MSSDNIDVDINSSSDSSGPALVVPQGSDAKYAVIFDLDGTLVDTSKSFDETIKQMVQKYSGAPLLDQEIADLRQEGGFNDDWVTTSELLRRRGFSEPLSKIVQEATELYLQLAPSNEFALFDDQLLSEISERHPLFIVTGRTRPEYNPIWGERLDPLFKRVYCLHDVPGKAPKPSPDYLLQVMEDFNLKSGLYVGNAVDDMWAARDANLSRIGITSTLPAAALSAAGAQIVLKSVNELRQVFSL
ncbi:HAD hydrolase-like protein [bacterium]|nr:HAD hydrolase-like protein [bacterium]MBP9808123.1 HAD hydrolase-like protein [bacterium]